MRVPACQWNNPAAEQFRYQTMDVITISHRSSRADSAQTTQSAPGVKLSKLPDTVLYGLRTEIESLRLELVWEHGILNASGSHQVEQASQGKRSFT